MTWNSFSEFLAMGGYAQYVWGSFGACALGFLLPRPKATSLTALTLRARLPAIIWFEHGITPMACLC
ncbi:MAG: hypothetical protein RL420_1464 [Pseudomonadota bacterium]